MKVALAYVFLVILWATTPLAIKWSSEGPGFVFGVTSRMTIGAICIALTALALRRRLPLTRKACLTYLAAAIQIFASMILVYWAAQFLPSGWISVLFGLTPMITALIGRAWFAQARLGFRKWCSYLLGVGGLVLMFGSAIALGTKAIFGIVAILAGAALQAVSALWVKHINAGLPAFTQVAGGLFISLPAYWLTWVIADGSWPRHFTTTSVLSIVYLGAIATTLGFVLYYFLLNKLTAAQVALITLICPVLALLLGHAANREPLTANVLAGSALILSALLLHEYSASYRRKTQPQLAPSQRLPRPKKRSRGKKRVS